MKRARQYDALRCLGAVQQLHVMEQQVRLLGAQAETAAAKALAEQCKAASDAAGEALDRLLGEGLFCPARYAILGSALLATEEDKSDSIVRLEDRQTNEAEQQRTWQKRRDQADWIDEQSHILRKRIARDEDDKRTAQAIDLRARRRVKN